LQVLAFVGQQRNGPAVEVSSVGEPA
jgi:hypothetical protein